MHPEGWRPTTIGDQVTLQRGIDITRAEQGHGSVPVVSSGGISSFHDMHAAEEPGVVLGRKGVVGSVYYITPNYWPHDTTLWVKDFKGNHRRFVYYFFKSIAERLSSLDVGSANPTLNRNHVHPIEVRWPPVDEQIRIADVLGSLDDKIEQNRRTGAKLEELARAVFKAWFVDFEPVKAKAAGATAFPGMPTETFAALPTRLNDSRLGPVPVGWVVGKLGENADINKSSVKAGQIDGEIEYVDIASVSAGHLSGLQLTTFGDAPGRARRRVHHGDTIWSCVRPNRRSYLFVHSPPANRIVSTGFAVISPKVLGAAYIHEATTRQEFVDYLVANADGSAYPAVRAEHFARADILIPTQVVRDAFELVAMPLRDLMAAGDRESNKLAALRDYLLPRLLSGKVRVSAVQPLTQPNAVPAPSDEEAKPSSRKASDKFKEAILIAALVRALANPSFPLGRQRYNKVAYFVHRKVKHEVRERYVKKAAGPYSPWAKYEGPEKIAIKNGYVRRAKVEKREGLLPADQIDAIDGYLPRYDFAPAIEWAVSHLRFRTKEDLELLATVDFAALELREQGKLVDATAVQELIASEPEWAPKLERAIFSDVNIVRALDELQRLFPADS